MIPAGSPWSRYVWVDQERLGGEVAFRGTRVPVRVLFEYLEGGYSIAEFIDDFEGVGTADVAAVLRLTGESIARWITAG